MTNSDGDPRPATVIRAVVFDVGGVLVDWDPRHLYRTVIPDESEREWFLANVCPPAWNAAQDAGRTWAEGVAEAIRRYPRYEQQIRAYDEQWATMLTGPIAETVAVLEELRSSGMPTYALTNFSAEKWPVAQKRFDFLRGFDGVVVSGEERLVKPDHRIYRLLLDRYGLDAATTFYVDDLPRNVFAAREVGMQAQVFLDADGLKRDLAALGVPGSWSADPGE